MTVEVDTSRGSELRDARALGIRVAAWLAALTIVEYVIAISLSSPLLWLLPLAAAKGWLIMKYFMHIKDLRSGGH